MRRATRLWVVLGCSCAFDSGGFGASSGASASVGSGADTTGGDTAVGGSQSGGATTDTPDDASAGSSGDSSTAPDDPGPTDDTASDTTASGPTAPALELAEAPSYDFPDVELGAAQVHGFVLSNVGEGTAVGVGAALEGASFTFEGGAFPGTSGTCTAELAPGAACVIAVAAAPPEWGTTGGTLTIVFTGGDPVGATLRVRGIGSTANLLVNGDAEQGGDPPVGWSETSGSGWRASNEFAFAGALSIWTGFGPGIDVFQLRQSVTAEPWAPLVDGDGVEFRVSGQTRSYNSGNDPHRVRLRFLADGGQLLQEFDGPEYGGTAWQAFDFAATAPSGTRSVQVELRCFLGGGDYCDAFFDALSLVARYD